MEKQNANEVAPDHCLSDGGDVQNEIQSCVPTMKKTISPQSTMLEVLEAYPGARHALFQRYHIGGCDHCGFEPTASLAEVCRRHGVTDVGEVINNIRIWQEHNGKASATPEEFRLMPLPESEAVCRKERARERNDETSYDIASGSGEEQ
jgi:hypothetical protein